MLPLTTKSYHLLELQYLLSTLWSAWTICSRAELIPLVFASLNMVGLITCPNVTLQHKKKKNQYECDITCLPAYQYKVMSTGRNMSVGTISDTQEKMEDNCVFC